MQIKEGAITYPSWRSVYAVDLISSISTQHWSEHTSNIYFRETLTLQLKSTSFELSKSENEAIEKKKRSSRRFENLRIYISMTLEQTILSEISVLNKDNKQH